MEENDKLSVATTITTAAAQVPNVHYLETRLSNVTFLTAIFHRKNLNHQHITDFQGFRGNIRKSSIIS